MSRPAGERPGAAAALAALLVLLPAAAAGAETEGPAATIRGRIIDASGAGVPGQVVRLLKSRTYVKLGGLRSLEQSLEDARATTDPLGFFEIDYRPDPGFPYYYLRFYDPKTFDAVKYRLPEDRDVTKRLRSGRPVQVSVSLAFAPDWPQVKRLLETYPPGSQVGQVLRSLGLPARRAPEGPEREVWSYDAAGVAYVVEGSKVIETRTIARRNPGAPGEPGPDAPVPAVRVDEP